MLKVLGAKVAATVRAEETAPRRGVAVLRALTGPAVVLLLLGVAACGDDGEVDEVELPELDANGMLGLEVTVVGDVTEIIDNNAFRMDKDGLDPAAAPDAGDPEPSAEASLGVSEDLDYYDTEALTFGDEELGYGSEQENVLVLVPNADLYQLDSDDPVRVSGTIRALDAEEVRELYGVTIETDLYAPYQDQLIVVAETVRVPSP